VSFFYDMKGNIGVIREFLSNFTRTGRRIRRFERKSTYTKGIFSRHIREEEIKVVFELGSRDIKDALAVNRRYKPEKIYIFECNPQAIKLCRDNLEKYSKFAANMTLVFKAVWDKNEKIKFYAVKESHLQDNPSVKTNNIGASSCFEMGISLGEETKWEEIEVEALRLEDFCRQNNISQIDLICMDLQGAEYKALSGLGDILRQVRYIITEAEVEPVFKGEVCLEGLKDYLNKFGFELAESFMEHKLFGNFLFINKLLQKA
jgi:FkbM family methyltransferase